MSLEICRKMGVQSKTRFLCWSIIIWWSTTWKFCHGAEFQDEISSSIESILSSPHLGPGFLEELQRNLVKALEAEREIVTFNLRQEEETEDSPTPSPGPSNFAVASGFFGIFQGLGAFNSSRVLQSAVNLFPANRRNTAQMTVDAIVTEFMLNRPRPQRPRLSQQLYNSFLQAINTTSVPKSENGTLMLDVYAVMVATDTLIGVINERYGNPVANVGQVIQTLVGGTNSNSNSNNNKQNQNQNQNFQSPNIPESINPQLPISISPSPPKVPQVRNTPKPTTTPTTTQKPPNRLYNNNNQILTHFTSKPMTPRPTTGIPFFASLLVDLDTDIVENTGITTQSSDADLVTSASTTTTEQTSTTSKSTTTTTMTTTSTSTSTEAPPITPTIDKEALGFLNVHKILAQTTTSPPNKDEDDEMELIFSNSQMKNATTKAPYKLLLTKPTKPFIITEIRHQN